MRSGLYTRRLLGCALLIAGCSDGASSDLALGSRMRVLDAQFVPGATPPAEDGPDVATIELLSTTIWPGYADKPLRGTLGASATSVALALSGDAGYWLLGAGPPADSAPELATFRGVAAFSRALAGGLYTFEVRAADSSGRFGPPSRQTLTALPIAPSRGAAGALVVTLTWDSSADVDLHVFDPLQNEIFHGSPSSRDPFGDAPEDASFGMLDVDSNADCAGDELRQEDALWAREPPAGHYSVRVDTKSLCGSAAARWTLSVTLHGTRLVAASGTALDSDTWGAHGRGAGLLALGFDVP
ncbi:MAG: hypothetical protein ABW061_26435 [Polyangiaceae bacterium]